jgi:hypothetical protein
MEEADRLHKMAARYCEFAERAGDPWIWDARLRPAYKLEKEAACAGKTLTQIEQPTSPRKT